MLLPTVMVLLALLVQPACVLYARSVMAAAAAGAARLALTGQEDDAIEFARRRLAAVPNVSVFHEGGSEGWEVSVSGPDDSGKVVVEVVGRARTLPLLGVLASALGEADGSDVVLRVSEELDGRSSWVGGDYDDWVGIWG